MLASAQARQKLASASAGQKTFTPELLAVAAFLVALFAANLATLELYPRAWNDEAMWLDPAVNLMRHNGLTSSTWYNVTFGQFWYGNTPLYVGMVFIWSKLVGDSLDALRSLNLILISLSALLLYRFACRSSELTSGRSRLAIVLLPILGYGITFAYRSGRPDTLCLALGALLLLATTLNRPASRQAGVIAVSALFPWAGLQLVAYAVIAAVLIVLGTGRRHVRTLLLMAAGMAVGGALMLAFYAASGHLKEFLIATVGSQRAVVGQVAQYLVLGDDRGPNRFLLSEILGAVVRDPSTVVGLAAAAILLTMRRIHQSPEAFYRLLAAVGVAVLVPLGMYFAGLYAIYYTWMALLPTWLCILAAVDRLDASARLERGVALAFLAGALLVGWPFLVGSATLQAGARDYGQVRRFVAQLVHPGDWAWISPESYFAVVEAGGVPFLCTQYAMSRLAPEVPPDQQQRLSVIVVSPGTAAKCVARLPGPWVEVARLHDESRRIPVLSWLNYDGQSDSYDLVAYRRAG